MLAPGYASGYILQRFPIVAPSECPYRGGLDIQSQLAKSTICRSSSSPAVGISARWRAFHEGGTEGSKLRAKATSVGLRPSKVGIALQQDFVFSARSHEPAVLSLLHSCGATNAAPSSVGRQAKLQSRNNDIEVPSFVLPGNFPGHPLGRAIIIKSVVCTFDSPHL
jgi:hypothetical protein